MAKINSYDHGQIVVQDANGKTAFAASALWKVDILVDRSHERIFLRLSDPHADEELAFLYTNAIEAASGKLTLDNNEPSASSPHWRNEDDWTPLVDGHFTYDVASECFKTSGLRIMGQLAVLKHLSDAVEIYAKEKKLGAPIFGRSAQMTAGEFAIHLPGKTRSALPRWGNGGKQGSVHTSPLQTVAANLTNLANLTSGPAAKTPPMQKSPVNAGSGQAPAPKPAPAVKKPMTFKKNNPTQKWF